MSIRQSTRTGGNPVRPAPAASTAAAEPIPAQTLLDALAAHVAVLDIEGNVVAVNAGWERSAVADGSIPRSCGAGSNYLAVCRDAGGAEGSEPALTAISAVLTGRRSAFTLEYPGHAPGQDRWFALSATGLPGPQYGAVITLTDVTAKRDAERAIHRRERWFRALARNASDIVAVLDASGIIRYVSESVESLLGYRVDDLVGVDGFAFDHPDDVPRLQTYFANVLGTPGTAQRADLRVRHADGSWRWFEVCATNLLADPDVAGIVVNARDISERVDAQTRLEERERWFRSLVQHAADLVSVMAADGTLLYQSPALERLLGYDPDARVGMNGLDLICDEDLPLAKQQLASLARLPGGVGTLEIRVKHADGPWRWFESTAINLLDDPTIGGFVVNSRDITERKELEDDLRRREARHRALLDAIPDLMFRLDRNGVCLDVKAEQPDLLAMPEEHVLRRSIADVLPGEVSAQALAAIEAALRTGQVQTFEYRLELPGGARDFEARVVASGNDETVSLVRDITERREAEARVSQSEERLRLSLEAAQIGAWDYHVLTKTLALSPTFSAMLGLPAEPRTLTSQAFRTTFVHPDDRERSDLSLHRTAVGGAFAEVEYRIVRPDGEVRWVVDKGRVVELAPDGRPLRSAGVAIDVTALRRTRTALEQRDRALEAASSGVLLVDAVQPGQTIVDLNPALERLTGCDRAELLGKPMSFLGGAETDPAALSAIEQAFAVGREASLTFVIHRKDGASFWAELHLAPVNDIEGHPTQFVGILNDVSERIWAERELRFRGELLDQATVGVIARDLNGVVTHWNRHAEALHGWSRDEAIGRRAEELLARPTDPRTLAEIRTALANGQAWEGEFICRSAGGGEVPVHAVDAPVHDEEGRTVGYVSVMVDISERKAFERELERLAYHDELTGLPNRTLFRERLSFALGDERRSAHGIAVLLMDLDRFKSVNDSFGHAVGDRALIEIAHRLSGCVRGEMLARFGGDEFAVLIDSENAAERTNALASAILRALSYPVAIGDGEGVLTASIGIALSGPDATPDRLLRDADVALYRVKESGRNGVAVFDPAMGGRAAERWQMENELRGAIDRGELRLVFQPLVDLMTGRVRKAEALVRWEHPRRGTVSPAEFIPLAEESGLIIPLGNWVIRQACEAAAGWPRDQAYGVCVNLSPRQLHHPDLPEVVASVLAETELAPERLILEITEGAAVHDFDAAAEALGRLKRLGVRIALDDFGTGYSSLAHIRRLPADMVKVDRAFVSGESSGGKSDRAVIGAIAALGHAMGLIVVAEGVESVEQRLAARAAGCDLGQGYYFSRPLGGEEFLRWAVRCDEGFRLNR